MRPSEVAHEGPAQLKGDRRGHAAQHPEAKHLPQHVDPGARDHECHKNLHGVGESNGKEIANQRGEAQGSRLPVERERHAEHAVRVPQGQMPLMDLAPHQICPRDEDADLVEEV